MRPVHLLAFVVLLVPRVAGQQILRVPQDFPTIQSAVDACVAGDIVLISAGAYGETVLVSAASDLLIQAKGKVVVNPPDGAAGLTLVDCTDVTVSKVRVIGAVDGIVLTGCTGGALQKCRVTGVTGSGIVLQGCDLVTVEACTIKDTALTGLALGPEPSDGCVIARNKVYRAGDSGVFLGGYGNLLEKNRVVESAGDGLRVESETAPSANALRRNKVVESGGVGIRVQGDQNELHQNTLLRCGGDAIRVRAATSCTVTECRVVKCAEVGVLVTENSSTILVSEARIRKPGTHGVAVDSAGAMIVACKSTGAGADGYVVAGLTGTWTSNVAKGSGSDGFEVSGYGNVLTFNKAKGSQDGFDLNDLAFSLNSIDGTNQFKTKWP